MCNVFFIFLTFPHSDDNIRFLGIIQKAQKNTKISYNIGKSAKNPCVIFGGFSFVSAYLWAFTQHITVAQMGAWKLKTDPFNLSYVRLSICLSVSLFFLYGKKKDDIFQFLFWDVATYVTIQTFFAKTIFHFCHFHQNRDNSTKTLFLTTL